MRKDPNCSLTVLLLLVTTLFCLRGAYSASSGSGGGPDCDESGSGSGGTGDQCTTTTTPPPLLCLSPEPPSETGDEALQKATCYVNCIDLYYRDPLFSSNDLVWNIIGRSELSSNCIGYRQLLECNRGCAMKLNEPASCPTTCVSQCENLGNVEQGACGLDCNQTRCEDGCSFEKPADNDYPEDQDPVAAPQLMPLETADEQLSGRYMVDITDSIPETTTRLGLSTLVFRVEDVEAPSTYTYYPLETLEDELNLKAFACKTVNISFSVATRNRGFSGYSPPQSVEVDVDFPGQLTTFTAEFVADERPGYLYQHIAQISFDTSELEGFELVTGYTVIIRDSIGANCPSENVFHYFPDHSDANNLTIYSSDRQRFFDNCFLSITVQVDPWNGTADRAKQTPPLIIWLLQLGLSPFPVDAIFTSSLSEYDISNEVYRTNITWTLNTAILPPAFITAIDQFSGAATIVRDRTRPGSFPVNLLSDGCAVDESQCVPAEDGRLTYSAIRFYLPETDRDIVDLYYNIPIIIVIQQNYTQVVRTVLTFDHNFDAIEIVAPVPIVENVTEYQDHTIEVLSAEEVVVTAFVTWPLPVVPLGTAQKFLIYFGLERLLQNARVEEVNEVPLSINVTYEAEIQGIFGTSEGINFTINLQIRLVATEEVDPNSPELDGLFFWSEPVIIQVVIPEAPNPITNISVTLVNQKLGIDEEGTIVAVVELNVTWSRPLLRVGTLESYDLYAGLQGLTPREQQLDDMQLRNNISASETSTTHVVTLPLDTRLDFEDSRLDFELYLQMRGVSEFGAGNWSEAVVTQVSIPDPPQPSNVTEIEVEQFEFSRVLADDKEQEVLTVTVDATWFPPNVINGNLTVYEAYLGHVALGRFDNPDPMDLRMFEANSTDGLVTFTFIISSPVDLFFQMRASNEFVAGGWSETSVVSIPEPPRPSVMTEIEVKDFKINIMESRKRALATEVIVNAVWSPPNVTNGNLTGYDAHIGLQPLESRDNPEDLKLTQFEADEENGTVNVTFTTENPTFLYFQMRARNEFIAGDWSKAIVIEPDIDLGGVSNGGSSDNLAAILGGTLPIVIIILIAVTVLLVIMIGYLGKKFYTRHKISNLFDQHDDENVIALGPIRHETFHLPPMLMAEKAPLLDQWEVPANEVIVDKQLGEGAFGEVYKGVIKGPLRNPKISLLLKQSIGIPVAIKLLKTTASGKEKADFLGEIEMMKKIAEGYNPHIVNMVGCVTLQEPLCLITEFVPHGDLLSYIRANRKKANRKRRREKLLQQQAEQAEREEDTAAPYLDPQGAYSQLDPKKADLYAEDEEDEEPYHELGELTATDLIQFAYQIATGMEYLASLNIVHRDLACRNILIGDDKKLKITDFGMSREVEEVYVKKTKGRLPLKWMAIECIIAREFTTSSDVWAYGVVLWEIGTLGGFPYPTVPNQDLLNMLKQGYRLEKPENCAPEVYQIMLECWNEDPQDRPTFSSLREKFGDLILAGQDDLYIDLQVDEMKPYYTIKEDEDEGERGSRKSSSEGSESSFELNKKGKQKEVIKKKSTNPYVDQPARLQTAPPLENQPSVPRETEIEECPYADQPAYRPTPDEPTLRLTPDELALMPTPGELAIPDSPSTPPEELSLGIPLDMLVDNAGQQPHQGIEHRTTNPYVDDPSTSLSTRVTNENGDIPSQREIVAIAEVFENPSPFSPPPMSPLPVEDQEGAVILTDT